MSGCSVDNGAGLAGSWLQAARLPAPPLRALGLEDMGCGRMASDPYRKATKRAGWAQAAA